MAIDLEALKAHCNVTFDEDNALLDRLLAASIRHVQSVLGFAIDDTTEFPAGTPEDVEQAVLMLAAHWYENREGSIVGVSAIEVPFGVADILANHRSYTYG